jgi:AhpD family alkylhydroperoxidase
MARIAPLPPHEFASDLQEVIGAEALARSDLLGSMRVWAHRPDLAVPLHRFMQAVKRASQLSPRLVELVRLRVAFHNQCRSCMAKRPPDAAAGGVSEELVCELVRPEEAADLTERERAALAYADRLAAAHHDMDDALFDRLREHFSDEEVIELGLHIALFIGLGRVAMSWDLVDELPEAMRAQGPVGPWHAVSGTVPA